MTNRRPTRRLEFFSSNSTGAKQPKLHLEYWCNGVSYQRWKLPTVIDDDGVVHAPLSDPDPVWQRLGRSSIEDWAPTFPKLNVFSPMTIMAINSHPSRPCRKCALEQVLDLAATTGKATLAVTFSGQFVPEEDGVGSFKWGDVTESAAERLERVAARAQLHTTMTSSGPVAYGLVTAQMYRALKRSLRAYQLDRPSKALVDAMDQVRDKTSDMPGVPKELGVNRNGALGQLIRTKSELAEHAIATYWTLRNHMPPELYDNEETVIRNAVLLTRAAK